MSLVLSKVGHGTWKGPSKAKVQIDVRSDDNNATTLLNMSYPDGTSIDPDGSGRFFFVIEDDAKPHALFAQILPPADPDDWELVEVGTNGDIQRLQIFFAGTPGGAIRIQPS